MDLQSNHILLILLAISVLSFVAGNFLAKRFRMADYGWRIGLVLFAVLNAAALDAALWKQIKLGIDLRGGVILIYEIDEEMTEAATSDGKSDNINIHDVIAALSRRLDPGKLKELVIRPYGEKQVEIIIPDVQQDEVDQIKRRISKSGFLEFRIVANATDHADIIDMALAPETAGLKVIRDGNSNKVGLWARVGKDSELTNGQQLYKFFPMGFVLRNGVTHQILTDERGSLLSSIFDPNVMASIRAMGEGSVAPEFQKYVEQTLGIKELDILMATDDGDDVQGSHVSTVGVGNDDRGFPMIRFTMSLEGAALMGNLTGNNLPDPQTGHKRLLGILLDNELLSAPYIQGNIRDRGQITGRFTRDEVNFLRNIIRAGRMPAVLNPVPINENMIGPTLGKVTIIKGSWAIGLSLVFVILFMALYYRFSGIIACLALLSNLAIILAIMILLKAAFTLPGLAGLVLTVGMSVDANVLIFERIREEMTRGAALRMAIRNGFARATTTIVDANLTTLITAVVLYGIGTDQVKGFAVTLILGILISMFTSIFCSRVIFDIAERRRFITDLHMTRILSVTSFDFIGKRRFATIVSLTLIVIGLAGVAGRGKQIFDTDFRGGASATIVLKQDMPEEQVRTRLDSLEQAYKSVLDEKLAAQEITQKERDELGSESVQWTLSEIADVSGANMAAGAAWQVVASVTSVDDFKVALADCFQENGESLLLVHAVSFEDLQDIEPNADGDAPAPASETPASETPAAAAAPPASEPASETPASGEKPKPADDEQSRRTDLPSDTVLAQADAATAPQTETPAADASQPPGESNATKAPAATPASNAAVYRTSVNLTFEEGVNADTLTDQINEAAVQVGKSDPSFILSTPGWDGQSGNHFNKWLIKFANTHEDSQLILDRLKQNYANSPVFLSSSKVGSQVAGDTQSQAVQALLASLLGIVAYIWFRFQKVSYGLAAVVALVHDVLLTLGAIALSKWLAPVFGIFLLEEFKISLPMVAAFLTIIGYSLNDTIVVFDRIREVRGKTPELTGDMINTSINQTLSRTLLTSVTTLLVVIVLYAIGGEGIHGFAFALVIGVVVGTYSSIFVASPALLWMTETSAKRNQASA